MNAKSERASLPDRVEAATVKLMHDMMLCRGPNNAGQTELVPSEYREIVELVLAAADACEAERNPNPTDRQHLFLGANAEQWSQADAEHLPENGWDYKPVTVAGIIAGIAGMLALLDSESRRAVSSEDVHREADPHDVLRRALQETGASAATKEAAERVIAEGRSREGNTMSAERISDQDLASVASWSRDGYAIGDRELVAKLAAELQEWRRGPSDAQIEAAAKRLHGTVPKPHRAWNLAEIALRSAWHVGKETSGE